jgi:hypothetical protein
MPDMPEPLVFVKTWLITPLVYLIVWQQMLQVEDLGPCEPNTHQKRAYLHDAWSDRS